MLEIFKNKNVTQNISHAYDNVWDLSVNVKMFRIFKNKNVFPTIHDYV